MLVTDRRRARGRELVQIVTEAVRGGVRLVQIRERDLPDDELRELVERLREAVGPEVVLIVNGSERVARTKRVGLHLSAAAPPLGKPGLARLPYGRSAHDESEIRAALRDGAEYLVLGTIFRTESKPDRALGGVDLVERGCRIAYPKPVYAIGGISVARVPEVLHAGAYGVAVCGAILSSNDPRRVAEGFGLALRVAG